MAATLIGSPAAIGVARFVRARHVAEFTSTSPSGAIASIAVPSRPIIHSRPIVGVANLVRTIDGMPTMNVRLIPPMPAMSASHEGRIDEPGIGSNRNQLPMTVKHDAHTGPEARYSHLHVDREGEHRQHDHHDGPGSRRKHRQPGEGEQRAHRSDRAGDADTGGEELEHQQREAGQQQQIGDRRAGHGVEELVDERQLGEPNHRDRVEPCRAVVEHDEFGGDQHDAVLLEAVHGGDHVADRRDSLVVDALLEHLERPCVGQPDRAVAETFFGDTEVDAHPVGQTRWVEGHADVARPSIRGPSR